MSREDVELARRYVEAFNAGGLDAVEHLWHPEVEAFDPPTFPDADRHEGAEGLRRLVESYLELGWDGQFWEPEFLDAGEEVLVIWQVQGRSAHGGGFPMDQNFAHLYLFEDGKVRRIRQFMSREEGLEAAGLAERPAAD